MIQIRYADLPEGLHVQPVARARRTIIYLRHGLTPAQRRASLRRARQSARMGYGPELPWAQVMLALAASRARTTLRDAMAAIRWHPVGALLLVTALMTMVVCYAMMVPVSVRIIPAPELEADPPLLNPNPVSGPVAPGDLIRLSHSPAPAVGVVNPAGLRSSPAHGPSPQGSSPGPSSSASSPSSLPPSPAPALCIRVGPLGICV